MHTIGTQSQCKFCCIQWGFNQVSSVQCDDSDLEIQSSDSKQRWNSPLVENQWFVFIFGTYLILCSVRWHLQEDPELLLTIQAPTAGTPWNIASISPDGKWIAGVINRSIYYY